MSSLTPVRYPARTALGVVVALAQLALAGAAQDRVEIDLDEHLPDLVEVAESRYAEFYDFTPFEAWHGKRVARTKLDEIVRQWAVERARAEGEIAALKADPRRHFEHFLERRLKKHHYFRDALGSSSFELVEGYEPFMLYVQIPDPAPSGYAAKIARYYGPWLQELEKIFIANYVTPQGLARREGHEAYAFFVLSRKSEYDAYNIAHRDLFALEFARAHYSPEYQIGVTYQEKDRSDVDRESLESALHESVHMLQHAYFAGDGYLPSSAWFNEGLAEYLSFTRDKDPRWLKRRPVDFGAVERLAQILLIPAFRSACLLPLSELAQQENYPQFFAWVRRRAEAAGAPPPPDKVAMAALYSHAHLLMHYLHEGEDRGHREAAQDYVRRVMAGEGNAAALESAFAGLDLAQLDAGFVEYLVQVEAGRGRALPPIPPAVPLERLGEAVASPAAAVLAEARSFTPESLRVDVGGDPRLGLAFALADARAGRFSAAARAARALLEGAGEAEELLERELVRLDGWVRLRREFLEHLRAKGKKLHLTVGGERLLAPVERVDEDRVHLGKSVLNLRELALDDIDPLELTARMRDRRKYDFAPSWLFAYPYALNADGEYREVLDLASPQGRALAEDAEGDLLELLRLSAGASALEEVAARGVPAGADEARATWEAVVALVQEHGDASVVAERKPALAQLATLALEATLGGAGVSELLHGEVTDRPLDRIRIEYAFDDPDELLDFAPIDYLASWRERRDLEGDSGFSIEGGALRGVGAAAVRHALEFEGRQTITYELVFHDDDEEEPDSFMLGLCDDGDESFVGAVGVGGLFAFDKLTQFHQQQAPFQPVPGRAFEVEVRHTGKLRIETRVDGERLHQVPCGPLKAGGLFLWVHGDDPVELRRLTIEGEPTEAGLARLRGVWIEGQLAREGLR